MRHAPFLGFPVLQHAKIMEIAKSSSMQQVVTSNVLCPGSGARNGFSAEHKLPPTAAARRPSGAGHPCKVHAVQPLRPASEGAGSSEQPWQQQRTGTRCCCILQGRLFRATLAANAQPGCQLLFCQRRAVGHAARIAECMSACFLVPIVSQETCQEFDSCGVNASYVSQLGVSLLPENLSKPQIL